MATHVATHEWLKVVLAMVALAASLLVGSALESPDQGKTARADFDVGP